MFRRRGRDGLAKVVEKVVMEVTMLGFVSLILLLFQKYVPEICVPLHDHAVQWTLLQNLEGCPCCLADTADITTCAQMYHGCSFNITAQEPYCGCSLGWEESVVSDTNKSDACYAYQDTEAEFVFEQFVDGLTSLLSDIQFNSTDFCNALSNETAGSSAAAIAEFDAYSGGGRRLHHQQEPFNKGMGVNFGIFPQHLKQQHPRRRLSATEELNDNDNTTHIIPKIGSFSCDGPFYRSSCATGSHPAITDEALHQLHLLVFLIAGFHMIAAVLVMFQASLRMRQWRRWQQEDQDIPALHTLLSMASTIDKNGSASSISAGGGEIDDGAVEQPENTTTRMGVVDDDDIEQGTENSNQEGENGGVLLSSVVVVTKNVDDQQDVVVPQTQISRLKSRGGGGADENIINNPMLLPSTTASVRQQVSAAASLSIDAAAEAAKATKRQWLRRDTMLRERRHFFREALICFGQALLPNLVSKQEFLTMRRAYIASMKLPPTWDFVNEATLHLDFSLVQIVGASATNFTILILQWLLSGVTNWIAAVLCVISMVVMLSINIWIVAMIRYSCRGDRPHRLKSAARWLENPRWLAYPLGGNIFLCSTFFSSFIFFMWQFGIDSCFFKASGDSIWLWVPAGMPWWGGLIAPAVMLHWTASVTVPAWALVVHMRPNPDKVSEYANNETGGGGGVTQSGGDFQTQAAILTELNRLSTVLKKMQQQQ